MIKLDMTKAYDRVNWNSFVKFLEKMGYDAGVSNKVWRLVAINWCSIFIWSST